MNEEFLIYLWANRLFENPGKTTAGEPVQVLKPGSRNTDSGPDFFDARIRIGETLWAGNVEVHLRASDWFSHGHHNDPAYDSIILHVVYENDRPVHRTDGQAMPTLELKGKFDSSLLHRYRSFLDSSHWIACEEQLDKAGHFERLTWLDNLMAERLEDKARQINNELKRTGNDFHEVFYRKLARNFGFNTNADTFEALAASLPLKILSKHSDKLLQTEALLFGQAGMLHTSLEEDYPRQLTKEYLFLRSKYDLTPLDSSRWKFLRMRPSNFPTIRISQFARLLHRSSGLVHHLLEADKLSAMVQLFNVSASAYWNDHFQFGKPSRPQTKTLGSHSIDLILINTVIPFTFVYGKETGNEALGHKAMDWLERIKPEKNRITEGFKIRGWPAFNAGQSQALIQLKTRYCDAKRCLECRIGHALLK